MVGKLALLIIGCGATGAGLLVIRQERINTAHRILSLRAQIRESERTLWRLQGEIARTMSPAEIDRLIATLDQQWATIPEPRPAFVTAPAATPLLEDEAPR